MANYASVANMGDPSIPEWQRQHLHTLQAPNGQSWQVNKKAAKAFEGLIKDLVAAGYDPKSSGGFNYRTKRGGTGLSQHAFGTAIDIGAANNPFLKAGDKVVTDLPPNTAEIAARHGLEWGGTWKRPDAMHFEWRGPVAGDSLETQIASAAAAMPSRTSVPSFGSIAPQSAAAPVGAAAPAPSSMPQFADEDPQKSTMAQLMAMLATQQPDAPPPPPPVQFAPPQGGLAEFLAALKGGVA